MLTPGAYIKARRCAANLSITDVAAKVATEPRVAEHVRADILRLIEADAQPATLPTIVALRHCFAFDLNVLERLQAIALGAPIAPPRLCRICACSQADGCFGPAGACHWVGEDLCSRCAPNLIFGDASPARAAA